MAVGDTISRRAKPQRPLFCAASGPDWEAIVRAVRGVGPDLLVVGDPYNDDGTPASVAKAANRFAVELGQRLALPVQRMDERYSSFEAADQLRNQRASGERPRRLQPGDLDSAAAAVILDSWLQQQP